MSLDNGHHGIGYPELWPERLLMVIARAVYPKKAYQRVIEPLFDDFLTEYLENRKRRRWKALYIRVLYSLVFLRVSGFVSVLALFRVFHQTWRILH